MSDQLVPTGGPLSPYGAAQQLEAWQDRAPAPAPVKSPLERPVAAIRRYKWLIIGIVILSGLGGFGATRFLTPQYAVQARVMVAAETQNDERIGPIRPGGLLPSDDWTQLLRSYVTIDPVVRRLTLYLTPDNASDAGLFTGFTGNDYFKAGKYELLIDRGRKRWSLTLASAGVPVDSGASTDSIGRALGFSWIVPSAAFAGTGEKRVRFRVRTPRETAVKLIDRLGIQRPEGSSFVQATLEDPNPALAADILNGWLNEFVNVAATLKKRKLSESVKTLEKQLQTARGDLEVAEDRLQSFQVATITKQKETGAPIAPGIQETRAPAVSAYFDRSIEYDEIKRDVALLRSLIAGLASDSVPSDALLQIRSVAANTPVTQSLRDAVADYHASLGKLANARLTYQDEHPIVKTLLIQINALKKDKIPQFASDLLRTLRGREVDDSTRLAAMALDLKEIPQRSIEEEQFRRRRDAAATLFTSLQTRYSEAQLAEASSMPDVTIVDPAIAPLSPTKNTAPRVILMALAGGIAAAIGLALLLDMLDGRLRYPEQATEELGLPLAGTVPRFPKGGINQNSPEQTFQLVESFRSLRMTVLQAGGGKTVALAISSAAPSEGKSLISANLAMSFADAGLRTVLVDGDTRRGTLDEMFGVRNAPGLTDYLGGTASLEQVVRSVSHPSLVLIPAGLRRRRSPELLTSPRLVELVHLLRAQYEVVIFDTPPLAAGVDGYSIASATGNLLMVLRVGKTSRRLASEKLRMFERLPVDIVGAVLNGIELTGAYGHYGYVAGYDAVDEAEPEVAKVT